MTTFILSETPETQLKNRVCKGRLILDEVSHGTQIDVVTADPIMVYCPITKQEIVGTSAWRIAREKIDNLKYEHERNAGWFMPGDAMVPA